jgi:hypothetical protein
MHNHMKFTITCNENAETGGGVCVTGFDVHPVSMAHEIPQSGLTPASEVATCNAEGSKPVVNDPAACLALKFKRAAMNSLSSARVKSSGSNPSFPGQTVGMFV